MKLMRCQICSDYTMQRKHHRKLTVTAHPISSGVSKHVEQRVKMRARKDD